MVSACAARARAGLYAARWVPADPDNPRVAPFDLAAETRTPIGELKVGTKVLLPRQGDEWLHPAVIFSLHVTNPACVFVRFPDYQTEQILKVAAVPLYDWAVGSRVACPRVAGGPLLEGEIKSMRGPVWKLDTGRESVPVLAKYCRDLRRAALVKPPVFCTKPARSN